MPLVRGPLSHDRKVEDLTEIHRMLIPDSTIVLPS